MTLSGKTALVTGGNRGIGLATVRALAEAGVQVHFTARSAANIAAAQRELGDIPATGHLANMTDRIAMATVLDQDFDILVNNAAVIAPIGRILDISAEDWAHSIDVNLTSAFHATQLALRRMVANGGGTIVNISSGAAHRPQEGWSAYCAGKAGLAMLTRSVHLEYADQGIRIFGFAPGVVDTDMQVSIRASGINPVSRLPRESLAPASEPARAIAWLCTPAADALNGQEIDVRTPDLRAAVGLPPLP
jgi:NAD(P)-dependent dehydrogenase (short-subunit alcohol dehydrogenase family)